MKMKRIISVITAVAMIATLSTGTAFAGQGQDKNNGSDKKQVKEFKDMKGHWGYDAVEKMQNYGIFNGYDDGTFKPDNTLSEAELAVLIQRIVDYKLGEDADNEDALNADNNGIGWGAGYSWGVLGRLGILEQSVFLQCTRLGSESRMERSLLQLLQSKHL